MSTSFPASKDSFTNPTATDATNSATVPHHSQHDNANDAIEAIEDVILNGTSYPIALLQSGSALGGDLGGTVSAATVKGLQGQPVSNAIPSVNEALVWNGSAWAPATSTSVDLPLTGGTMSGAIDMGNHKITTLANGSASSDAAAFGQIPTAASTVTGPDSFGATATAGTAATFSRSDHDHGLPANPVPSFATPSAIGQSNTTGSASTINHSDHVHQGVTSVTAGTGITVTGGDGSGHGAITVAAASASGALTRIAQVVLASPAATIDFSAIPGTYENLILQLQGRCDDAAQTYSFVIFTLNGDTGNNYSFNELSDVMGSTPGGGGGSGIAHGFMARLAAASSPAGAAGMSTARINGYARTVFQKIVHAEGGALAAATNGVYNEIFDTVWLSTAAVTEITLSDSRGGNFIAGTVATLYGET